MLERVWRKGNPLKLLVGMQTSIATMEGGQAASKCEKEGSLQKERHAADTVI